MGRSCLKMAVFWVVAQCMVEVYRRFRGACCFHHQGDEWSPRQWRHQTPLKRCKLLSDYTMQQFRKQPSLYLPTCEPQISWCHVCLSLCIFISPTTYLISEIIHDWSFLWSSSLPTGNHFDSHLKKKAITTSFHITSNSAFTLILPFTDM
jgi:hypothetical protein